MYFLDLAGLVGVLMPTWIDTVWRSAPPALGGLFDLAVVERFQ